MNNPFEEIIDRLTRIEEMLSQAKTQDAPPIEIITRAELMKRLGITEPTAIRWGKLGRIPEIRIGASVRYNWPVVIDKLGGLDNKEPINYRKREIANLSDNYIKSKLSRSLKLDKGERKLIPKEAVELKRNVMKIKRELNN